MKKVIYLLLLGLLTACAANKAATPSGVGGASVSQMSLTSPAFASEGAIPEVYSCKGEDRSMTLAWDAPPGGTKSLALVMDDPDAPVGTWVHWVVYNIPPDASGLAEGASRANGASTLPEGSQVGLNSWKRADYGGPCPPSGTHRYYFRIYALDTILDSGEEPLNRAELLNAIDGHVLAQGELMGKFGK